MTLWIKKTERISVGFGVERNLTFELLLILKKANAIFGKNSPKAKFAGFAVMQRFHRKLQNFGLKRVKLGGDVPIFSDVPPQCFVRREPSYEGEKHLITMKSMASSSINQNYIENITHRISKTVRAEIGISSCKKSQIKLFGQGFFLSGRLDTDH